MAESLFKQALGADATRVSEPESVFAFRDHLTFLGRVMSPKHREMGLLEKRRRPRDDAAEFHQQQNIRLYGESPEGGSEAICHNAVVEDLALPGQIVIGTDSHTCMAGVLGCFAFRRRLNRHGERLVHERHSHPRAGDGALRSEGQEARGRRGEGRDALHPRDRLHEDEQRHRQGAGVCRRGFEELAMDERATLTNMAVEAGGTTGIIEPDEVTLDYIVRTRGLDAEEVRKGFTYSDPDAEYAAVFEIDLDEIGPMVATPGDPRTASPSMSSTER